VSYNWQETREQRDRFIRAVYDLRDPNTGWAVGDAIMQRMSLDPENIEDGARYSEIARYFDEFGYIRRKPAVSASSPLAISASSTSRSKAICVVKKSKRKAEQKASNVYYSGPVVRCGGVLNWSLAASAHLLSSLFIEVPGR
jgi:hypothetical protein